MTSQNADDAAGDFLALRDISFYFKFAFDVGRDINPIDAASLLLDTDLAVAAVWQGEAWEAKRFQQLKTYRRVYEQMLEAQERLDQGVGDFLRYVAVRPRLLRAYVSTFRKRSRDTGNSSAETDKATPEMTIDEIDDAVAKTSSLQSLLELVDSDLFNPDFLREGPWLRVELQPAFLKSGDRDYAVDVWLLLHRSGNAVMTFALHEAGPMTPAEVSQASMAGWGRFEKTELALWTVETSALGYRGWEPKEPQEVRFSSGVTWGSWCHDEPASIADVFTLYQDALVAALAARSRRPKRAGTSFASQWTCYPVLAVRDADTRVFDRHDVDAQAQMGALMARVGKATIFDMDKLLEFASRDMAIRTDQRSWINGGLAVTAVSPERRESMAARYGSDEEVPGQDWIWIEQQFAVPFDFMLLQYHAAHSLLAQVKTLPLTAEAVHILKARVLAAKTAFWGAPQFAYGTLNEMAEAFHLDRYSARTWTMVDDGLDLVDSVLQAETAATAERRGLALQVVLGIAAVVLGIPAAHRIVEILGGVEPPESEAWFGIGRLVELIAETAQAYAAALVASLVLLFTALVLASLWIGRRRRDQRRPLVSRAAGQSGRKRPVQYFEPGAGFEWVIRSTEPDE